MSIKRTFISYGILIAVGVTLSSFAINNNAPENEETPAKAALHPLDNRISLELSPEIKVRQLTKMRSHFKSIQSIIRLIGEEQFIEAASIAETKLVGGKGKKILSAFIHNDSFKQMGAAFHESAGELSEALKTKDTKKSLLALNATINHCTQCHEVFRQ